MALIWADRIRETSSTSGTGSITPSGAYDASFKTIGSAMATSDTAYFTVKDGSGTWQTFLGTWNGTTVARTTGLSGSSGASNVSLSGTGVEIWIDAPASWVGTRAATPSTGIVYSDGSALAAATIGGGLALSSTTLQATMTRSLQSTNYTIVAGDRGKLIEFTGSAASTITLTAAATLGAGWYCILKHSGTGTTAAAKKLAISGTLDGVSSPAVYPGDARILQSDGTNITSVLLTGGYIEIAAADSPFTLTIPTGQTENRFQAWGGAGGGGSGTRFSTGIARSGGGGGGGGGYNDLNVATADIGATSLTCTIGAGGAGGAAVTTDSTSGNNGTAGGNTTIGTLLTAYGGGYGYQGGLTTSTGGGGGGTTSAGGNGVSASAVSGGGPSNAASGVGGFGGGGCTSSSVASGSGWGGGGGAGCTTAGSGNAGGCSYRGGGGGGGGGGISSGTTTAGGGAGGSAVGANGGGGAAGAAGASGTAGTAGPTPFGPGTAGGGGGSNAAGAAGSGGNGGIACGGGGGGAAQDGANSGAGGLGGNGLIRYGYRP